MSFSALLKNARQKAKEDILNKTVNTSVEENINTPKEEEVITEEKQNVLITTLGDAIIMQSESAIKAVKKSKLKGPSGAARRIAKAIGAKNIKLSQLNKAFDIQKRFGIKRPEWHVVGSYALQELRNKLDNGVSLNDALNSPYEWR